MRLSKTKPAIPQGPRGTIHHKINEALFSVGLPFSNDAEKGVLSCFLHNPDLLTRPHKEEWFNHPANLLMFQAMMAVVLSGAPLEYIALSQYLRDQGIMDKVGGQGTVAELLDFVPTPMHYQYYVDTLIGRHLGRTTITSSLLMMEAGYGHDPEEISKLANEQLNIIATASQGIKREVSMSDHLDEWQVEWNEMASGKKPSAMPTRWRGWNKKFMGLRPGYTVIMGMRGSGKSVLSQNIGSDAALVFNRPVVIISYEMAVRMILNRIIADIGEIHGGYLFCPDQMPPTPEIIKIINSCLDRIRASKMKIIHNVTWGANDCANYIRAVKAKEGDCVAIIDYLQLLTKAPKGVQCDLGEQIISANSAIFRDLSKELDIPIIALSQINKQGVARGSEAPELDADDIYRIERYRKDDGTIVDKGIVNCVKSRNGDDGPIPLKLNGPVFRFEEPLMP